MWRVTIQWLRLEHAFICWARTLRRARPARGCEGVPAQARPRNATRETRMQVGPTTQLRRGSAYSKGDEASPRHSILMASWMVGQGSSRRPSA